MRGTHKGAWPALPCWPFTFAIKLWKQKRRGSMYPSALIPTVRPSHCPLMRISNVKPAHASDYIYTYTTAWSIPEWRNERTTDIWIHGLLPSHIYTKSVHLSWGVHLIIYIKGNDSRRRDIKSTHVDVSRCITAVHGFKFAKFETTDSNVKKTSFRDWPYNWPEVSFHRCF